MIPIEEAQEVFQELLEQACVNYTHTTGNDPWPLVLAMTDAAYHSRSPLYHDPAGAVCLQHERRRYPEDFTPEVAA